MMKKKLLVLINKYSGKLNSWSWTKLYGKR